MTQQLHAVQFKSFVAKPDDRNVLTLYWESRTIRNPHNKTIKHDNMVNEHHQRRRVRRGRILLIWMAVLVALYVRIWIVLSQSSPLLSSSDTSTMDITSKAEKLVFHTPPLTKSEDWIGQTMIVGFCNFNYRSIGVAWYERMTNLGYFTHVLVATDPEMAEYLKTHTSFRYYVSIHEPMPAEYKDASNSNPKAKKKKHTALLKLLMAVRWKFLLEQLKLGIHVLLTDVDNIFSQYIDMEEAFTNNHQEVDSDIVDVWHAYATKFPQQVFAKQGFVVCSGMSWWRASKAAIKFGEIMHSQCGTFCDDQRVLNNLLVGNQLNMTWEWTKEIQGSRITNVTTQDMRFVGLPTLGISGRSNVTGHRARVWDRDFAFRGSLRPEPCPRNNWVSMPVLEAHRRSAWRTKLESFEEWDRHCATAR